MIHSASASLSSIFFSFSAITFAIGILVGQLVLTLLIFVLIKLFLLSELDDTQVKSRTLSHVAFTKSNSNPKITQSTHPSRKTFPSSATDNDISVSWKCRTSDNSTSPLLKYSRSRSPSFTWDASEKCSINTSHDNITIPPSSSAFISHVLTQTKYKPHYESVDWLNVLAGQALEHIRADFRLRAAAYGFSSAVSQQSSCETCDTKTHNYNNNESLEYDDENIATACRALEVRFNTSSNKPAWLGYIHVKSFELGNEYPVLRNCRIIQSKPVSNEMNSSAESTTSLSLLALIDVEFRNILSLAIDTKLILNFPRPAVAVLPISLTVTIEEFSGIISLSLEPPDYDNTYSTLSSLQSTDNEVLSSTLPLNPSCPDIAPPLSHRHAATPAAPHSLHRHSPTLENSSVLPVIVLRILPTYTLNLRTSSLVGARARLSNLPKISQLVESRVREWFHDKMVSPHRKFPLGKLPSLWFNWMRDNTSENINENSNNI